MCDMNPTSNDHDLMSMESMWNSIQSLVPSEQYSRKVFVGGLPIDVGDAEVQETFAKYGPLFVDWPRRSDRERPGMNHFIFG